MSVTSAETDSDGDASECEDPVYRRVRASGLVLLATFAYFVILGPVFGTVLGPPADAASAVGPATDRSSGAPSESLRAIGSLVLVGLPAFAGVVHVALGVRLRPLGLFLLAQVGVRVLVVAAGLLVGGLTGGGAGLPGAASLTASYLLPLWYVRRDRNSPAEAGAA